MASGLCQYVSIVSCKCNVWLMVCEMCEYTGKISTILIVCKLILNLDFTVRLNLAE